VRYFGYVPKLEMYPNQFGYNKLYTTAVLMIKSDSKYESYSN